MYADTRFQPLPVEAVTLLQEGHFIEAIKAVREAEDLGLKDAKARVDAYLAREPLLKAQIELRKRATGRKIFLWFLIIDVIVVAGVIYWMRYGSAA